MSSSPGPFDELGPFDSANEYENISLGEIQPVVLTRNKDVSRRNSKFTPAPKVFLRPNKTAAAIDRKREKQRVWRAEKKKNIKIQIQHSAALEKECKTREKLYVAEKKRSDEKIEQQKQQIKHLEHIKSQYEGIFSNSTIKPKSGKKNCLDIPVPQFM